MAQLHLAETICPQAEFLKSNYEMVEISLELAAAIATTNLIGYSIDLLHLEV